jgi:hypothetical protein
VNLYINQIKNKTNFRNKIYAGDVFLETSLSAAHELCAFARASISETFDGINDPQSIHQQVPVKEFVALVSKLKKQFTNSITSKEIIRDFVIELGASPKDYLLDVPRIRVVPRYDYLHAGVSYAYKPHRDTWYGSVSSQINTWMPVYSIDPDQTMMINPSYFDIPVVNSSKDWSLENWVNVQRPLATTNIEEESRVHPVAMEEINNNSEVRIAANGGEMLIFSGAHLHGTVPNHTTQTRFSIDFRLIHIDDLKQGNGARNVDNGCRDPEVGFKDLFHVSDFSNFQGVN